ncbi:MAG TPA: cytochrome c3 family protein [bacterium]|nr:cytochrome c3 family protein [bacterium]
MTRNFNKAYLIFFAPLVLALGGMLINPGNGVSARMDSPQMVRYQDGFVLHGDTSVPDENLIKQYQDKIPETLMLNKLAKKLPPVPYNHKQHVDLKTAHCGNCHHEDVKNIKPCWECHNEKPADPKSPEYLKAYHGLCVECHKAVKSKKGLGDGDKPPDKKCYDCHLKPEGGADPSAEPASEPK